MGKIICNLREQNIFLIQNQKGITVGTVESLYVKFSSKLYVILKMIFRPLSEIALWFKCD